MLKRSDRRLVTAKRRGYDARPNLLLGKMAEATGRELGEIPPSCSDLRPYGLGLVCIAGSLEQFGALPMRFLRRISFQSYSYSAPHNLHTCEYVPFGVLRGHAKSWGQDNFEKIANFFSNMGQRIMHERTEEKESALRLSGIVPMVGLDVRSCAEATL